MGVCIFVKQCLYYICVHVGTVLVCESERVFVFVCVCVCGRGPVVCGPRYSRGRVCEGPLLYRALSPLSPVMVGSPGEAEQQQQEN